MNNIKNWIIESYENKKLSLNSCIFISGNSGIGKTHYINNLAKDLELFIINIDSFNCSSSVQLSDLLMKSFVSSLIQILTNNNSRKIIIIDDFDILIAIDSTINITLCNFLIQNTNKLKHIPIICIINNSTIKKLGDIKKKCKIIEFPNIDEYEFYNILKSYDNSLDLSEALKIIKTTNYNLSDAIRIITKTYYNNNDKLISIEDLYSNDFNRNNLRRIINKEQWLIPLNFHENIITEIYNNRCGYKKEKEGIYKDFLLNFCYFDCIMNKSNEIGIELFISSIEPFYSITAKKKKTIKLCNFTKMLSYLSLQKKNNKSFYNYKSFPFHQIGNYHLNLINRKFIY